MNKPSPARYRTTNWSSYNVSLRKRGSLLVWVDKEMIWRAPRDSRPGRPPVSSDAAIRILHEWLKLVTEQYHIICYYWRMHPAERSPTSAGKTADITFVNGLRGRLIVRGQARAMIWRDGVLTPDAPAFSPQLIFDLQ